MIIDIKGKHFVFGMKWRPLIGQGSPATLAAQAAKTEKTDIWHDGRERQIGTLDPADSQIKVQGQLHAGAIALTRIKSLGTTFIFVCADKDVFFVCGVVRGRPRKDFDLVLSTQQEVADAVRKFAASVSASFVIAGNVDGVRDLVDRERDIRVEEIELVALATVANETTALRRPRASSVDWARLIPRVFMGASCLALLGMGAYKFLPNPFHGLFGSTQHEPTDNERYQAALTQLLNQPTYRPTALTNWLAWWTSQPLIVGGWIQTKVDCSAVLTACAVTFVPTSPLATNRDFANAMPSKWPMPDFDASGQTLTEHLTVTGLPTATTGQLVANMQTANQINLDFGSQLQRFKRVSLNTTLQGAALFGGVGLNPAMLARPVYRRKWIVNGPLRNVDLIAQFPAYAAVEGVTLVISPTTTPTKTASKLALTATGYAFQRNQ